MILLGGKIHTKHFRSGKTIGISPLDEKPTHATCGIRTHDLPVTQKALLGMKYYCQHQPCIYGRLGQCSTSGS